MTRQAAQALEELGALVVIVLSVLLGVTLLLATVAGLVATVLHVAGVRPL